MKDKAILLSYPGSGSTWLRYCVEFLTKRLTEGYGKNVSIENGLGRLVDIGVDCNKPPIAYKRHGHNPGEKDSYDMDNDRLVLLLRNYKENIVRYCNVSEAVDTKFYSETQGYRDGELDYIGCLQIYEEWRAKKILIYYEDLINDPEPELVKVLELLKFDKTYLNELMNNLDFHKKQCIHLYIDNKAGQSYTQGNSNKLLFHSQGLSDKQKREWDHHIESNYPELMRKYLRRYKEAEK